jgi:hypothetical protein
MTFQERQQQKTEELWARIEQRESDRRFAVLEPELAPAVSAPPKRYRFFSSSTEAYQDPVVGPLMKDEERRERNGEPATFSLL